MKSSESNRIFLHRMARLGQSLCKNQEDFDSNVEEKGASTASEDDTVE